jgi:phosphatidyl-myo-inositol dimannoside synthase
VLIISTQCFAPATGGIESVMYSMALEISSSGEEVIVFADKTNSPIENNFDNEQLFTTYRYGGIKPLRRHKKARDIYKIVSSLDVGTSITLLSDTWKSVELIEPSLFTKVVCLAHGSEIPKTLSMSKQARISRSFAKTSNIIANSQFTADLVRHYVDNQTKIITIYPGINIPKIDLEHAQTIRQKLEKHAIKLISIARLETRKNHRSVIESIPGLIQNYPSLLYIIVGDGHQRRYLEDLSKKLNVNDHVLFTGTLLEEEKNSYLANSDLFVMPGTIVGNDVEGFGLAYIEAGYFGLPSIACNIGGAPEAVLHNQTGLICESGNQAQLEKSIYDLLGKAERRRRLGKQAKIHSAEFLWNNRIKDYLKVLF